MESNDDSVNKFGFLAINNSQQSYVDKLKENARLEKWYFMLEHWENYTSSHLKKIKRRIRKGIPNSIRGLI